MTSTIHDPGRHPVRILGLLAAGLLSLPVLAEGLEEDLGRSEVRVRSGAYPLVAGRTVQQIGLPERLERLGYERVAARPDQPGSFFYGHEVFWIYRRAHRLDGRDRAASLIGLQLRKEDGMILGARGLDGSVHPLEDADLLYLEPEMLAESLDGNRAERIPIRLDSLPEQIWRALLAAEDARFFDHGGIDGRSVARAALANIKGGKVSQGGSTITQQLIKNRDLTPKRSFGRKFSEAIRATWLETVYTKWEILQAYLNQVYYGHVGGLAVHGIGTAARAYYSKDATQLSLAEAAMLAGIIQGPNRLNPERHPERARERRDWVLDRMEDLGWVEPDAAVRARRAGLGLRLAPPRSSAPRYFLDRVARETRTRTAGRLERGRGVVVETTLDPYLQQAAEEAVSKTLARIRRDHRALRNADLSAALVALDADSGAILAYVGGDPAAEGDRFDRVRRARRQPGSTVKPLVLLEAMDRCGDRAPLNAASRVADEPLRVELASGAWLPENFDHRFLGVIDLRSALAQSRNVPLVRVAQWCGIEAIADAFRRAGLPLPEAPPVSFVLGSVEVTPIDLAAAYTAFATPGDRLEPFAIRRIEKPEGSPLDTVRIESERIARRSTAWLVRDLMRSAVERGTARVARIDGVDVAAKTGSSSELRDAWFAGHGEGLVTVVWVGLDDGSPLGLSGSVAAGPLWREFMQAAVRLRPARELSQPRSIVERWVDPDTGLLVRERNRKARSELFRRGALPPRDRFWRSDPAVPVVR